MNASISANETISSNRVLISLRFIPRMAPCRNTFSRPVRSGWKPAATSISAPARRHQDAREQLEDGRLARPVRPENAERFAGAHLERDVAHRPELFARQLNPRRSAAGEPAHRGRHEIAQAVVQLAAREFFPYLLELDARRAGHVRH